MCLQSFFKTDSAIPREIMPASTLNIFKPLCRITMQEKDEKRAHMFCAMSGVLLSTLTDLFSVFVLHPLFSLLCRSLKERDELYRIMSKIYALS